MTEPGYRLFTLEEANALLPTLRRLLRRLGRARSQFLKVQQELAERLHRRAQGDGRFTADAEEDRLAASAEEGHRRWAQAAQAIDDLGCELKDPERGMVDFRTLREGRVVYLCWLMEEPRIRFWHELDAGYAGRQAL